MRKMHFELQQKMSSETLKPKPALPERDTNPVVTESDIALMPENSWLQVLEQEAPHLFVQLEAYVKILHSRLSNRIDDKERVERGLDWAGKYIAWKFLTRLNRANDLSRQDENRKAECGRKRRRANEIWCHEYSDHDCFQRRQRIRAFCRSDVQG